MDPTIHVQEMHVAHRKELSHRRANQDDISNHPSLSVSYIKKRLLPGPHRLLPIQVSFLNFSLLLSIEDCFDLISALSNKRYPIT